MQDTKEAVDVTKLTRHEVDLEIARRQVASKAELLALTQTAARSDPGRLNALFLTARDYASYLAIVDPNSSQMAVALKAAVQAALAIFAVASATEGSVEVDLGADAPAKLPAKGPTGAADAGNWRSGFQLAVICRDHQAVDRLCQVPISVIRDSSTQSDECAYLYVEALQSLWRRAPDAAERLRAAVDATDPDKVKLGTDYVLNILVPELELVYRFAMRDGSAFNEALRFALERHKKYWGQKKLHLAASGFVAWGAVAMAALAGDADIPIAVESDYLSPFLYRGTFLKT